jgi:hypothetical protein
MKSAGHFFSEKSFISFHPAQVAEGSCHAVTGGEGTGRLRRLSPVADFLVTI